MRVIHKFLVEVGDRREIKSHKVIRWLDVQVQSGDVVVWAEVDAATDLETSVIHIRGTGHPMDGSEGRHIGTFQLSCGSLVFHVFADSRADS